MTRRNGPEPHQIWLLSLVGILMLSCTSNAFLRRQAEQFYYRGQALLSQGKLEEAFKNFDQSFTLSERAGDRAGMAHNLNEKAIIYASKSRYGKARQSLGQAIDIYKTLGMNPEVSKALNNMALSYLRERRIKAALDQYGVLLEWDRGTGNRLGEAIVLNQMGWLYAGFLNNPKKAYAMYADARDIFTELGKIEHLKVVEANIATLLNQVSRPSLRAPAHPDQSE
jgi:tetratricopeptide (TPR) repeat protein